MNLRAQLALVCLSLLILPWALFLFIGELDRNLREDQLDQSQEDSVAAASSVIDGLANLSARVRPESKTLLAGRLSNNILLDGYADDWSAFEMDPRAFGYSMNKVSVEPIDQDSASSFTVLSAVRGSYLYLFVKVKDQQINYHQPTSNKMATGDQLVIRVPDSNSNIRRYTFRWEAPGLEVGRYFDAAVEGVRPIRTGNDFRAALAESADGYHVELRMPMPLEGKFALSVIDVDANDPVHRWTGMFDPDEPDDVGQLHVVDKGLSDQLALFTEPGMRVRVFNGQGWMLADSDQRLPDTAVRDFAPADKNLFDAVLYRFITWSLERNVKTRKFPEIDNGKLGVREFQLFADLKEKPEFLKDKYRRVFHASVFDISRDDDLYGYLLVQQPRASLTAFTEAAMLRLVKIFGLAVSLIALVLIGFASLISWRVKMLRDSIEQSVTRDGVIVGSVEGSVAPDEIGDLSRSFHTIIKRLDGYTSYLQSLGSRLSHELRTPLSVVSTSLEGIDKSALDAKTTASIERAELGAERLQRLIRNLSEASSVEQTIQRSTKVQVDLIDWIKVAREVYDSLHADRTVVLRIENSLTTANVEASVELLHQMLDKLISNAVDFSTPGSEIIMWLSGTEQKIDLAIENTGSALPLPSSELFEPMVSVRDSRDDQPHMGFGLHIVKLIADFHQAGCSAQNISDRGSVIFSVSFPRFAEA